MGRLLQAVAQQRNGSDLVTATHWELAIWSAMAGAILLLAILASADLVVSRSVPAGVVWRFCC